MISATERVDTITIILPINEEENDLVFGKALGKLSKNYIVDFSAKGVFAPLS